MPTPKQRPTGTSYIPTLDGWRAIAILSVMLCHGLDQKVYPFAEALGYAGVLLFFAISGFLITSRMLEENRLTGTVSLSKFYIRRAFRILPPALFFLATIVVLGLAGVIPFSASSVLKALVFVRNYTFLDYSQPATWFSAHFWSLSVEEHFYLIWPAIFLFAGVKRLRWVAPGLAIATILWRVVDERYEFVVRVFHAPYLAGNWGRSDYLADVLLWGCTLAIWLGQKPWKSPLPRGTTTLVCAALIGFLYVSFFTSHISHARNFVNLFMALLVGCTVTDPGSVLGRFLEWAPLRYIGRLSYSLYLWQQLFFHVDREPFWFQRFPLSIVLIFGCACFSYYIVERPTVRLGHRFARPAKLGHADDLEPATPATVKV
jgi:peptidoglycan/LPS O-acetylase OafA/YrhL